MTTSRLGNDGSGIAFIVSAGIVYEIIAAACSSPQTTEINADKRAETLMKWVHIGAIQAGGFIILGAVIDPGHAAEIMAGGAAALVLLYAQYLHARKAGLAKAGAGMPGTEEVYDNGNGGQPCAHCGGKQRYTTFRSAY